MSITRVREKIALELVEVINYRLKNSKTKMPDDIQAYAMEVLHFGIHADKPHHEALRLLRTQLKFMLSNGYEPQNEFLTLLVEPIIDVELIETLGLKIHQIQTKPEKFEDAKGEKGKTKKSKKAEANGKGKEEKKSGEGSADADESKAGSGKEESESGNGADNSEQSGSDGSGNASGSISGGESDTNAGSEDKGDSKGSGDQDSDDESSVVELPTKRGELNEMLIDLGVDETEVNDMQNKDVVIKAIKALQAAA